MFGKFFGKKKEPTNEKSQSGSLLSMPLFRDTAAPDIEALTHTLKQLIPAHEIKPDTKKGAKPDDVVAIGVPSLGAMVMLAHMPAKIPGREVDENAQCTRWWNQKMMPVPYASHAVLMAMAPTPVAAANAATLIALGLMHQKNAVGWYVGGASSVFPPEFVKDVAVDCLQEGSVPVPLWVNVIMSKGAKGIDASTLGLEQFGQKELEVVGSKQSPEDIGGTLFDLAGYLLNTGAVFEHGQTCGGSEEERWKIEVGASKLGKEGKVARIVMP
jgi:hypothetical protein